MLKAADQGALARERAAGVAVDAGQLPLARSRPLVTRWGRIAALLRAERVSRVLLLRAGPVVTVLLLTLVAFRAGVDVSARPGVPDASIGTQLYYAIGLFILGGLDLGVPVDGPPWARALLWVAYFLGPAITTTAVVEGAIRALNPPWLVRLRHRQHVVIVGLGRLGVLYLDAVGAVAPGRRVVAVDLDAGAPGAHEVGRRPRAHFVSGDIRRDRTRWGLHLHEAHAVVLTTSADLVNLGAAWEIAREHPHVRVAAHVSDIGMHRTAARLAERSGVQVFNSHEIAAAWLYGTHLARHFSETGARDVVVIAGFGRFGQTILQYIQAQDRGDLERAVVVDLSASARARQFDEQIGFRADCAHSVIDADIADPEAWSHIGEAIAEHDVVPVLVLATDDDSRNLRAAIGLRGRFPAARIFVRCFSTSAFVTAMAREHRFEPIALDGMLREALCQHYATQIDA